MKARIFTSVMIVVIATGYFLARGYILNRVENEVVRVDVETIENYIANVPSFTQAPLETEADWLHHEESCEEAASTQAYHYETGKSITKQEASDLFLDMIAWQEENIGGHIDLYAEDMHKFITGYHQLEDSQVKVVNDAQIQDLKDAIDSGHPVIAPITGAILQNPYYEDEGYHMLTVIGYTEDQIITNDNGTKRGKDFVYDVTVFEEAFRDAGGFILYFDL